MPKNKISENIYKTKKEEANTMAVDFGTKRIF